MEAIQHSDTHAAQKLERHIIGMLKDDRLISVVHAKDNIEFKVEATNLSTLELEVIETAPDLSMAVSIAEDIVDGGNGDHYALFHYIREE